MLLQLPRGCMGETRCCCLRQGFKIYLGLGAGTDSAGSREFFLSFRDLPVKFFSPQWQTQAISFSGYCPNVFWSHHNSSSNQSFNSLGSTIVSNSHQRNEDISLSSVKNLGLEFLSLTETGIIPYFGEWPFYQKVNPPYFFHRLSCQTAEKGEKKTDLHET